MSSNDTAAVSARTPAVGVLGIGYYLPEQIRGNDFWPADAVATWPRRMEKILSRAGTTQELASTEGVRLTKEALASHGDDPFLGVRERRVLPDDTMISDMEAEAARRALAVAEVAPEGVDALLTSSMVSDYLTVNDAAAVHHRLGMRRDCLCTAVDSVCNSFLVQLEMARGLVATGAARTILLVQSSAVSRICDYRQPYSAWAGDGATAVVVGPVTEGRGVRAIAHRTASDSHAGLVTSGETRPWYDGERAVARIADPAAARRTVFGAPELLAEALTGSLEHAAMSAGDVAFFACHQNNGHLHRVVQALAGLSSAEYVDTFAWTGSLSAANIPFQLALAAERGLLGGGDGVAVLGMGNGLTVSAGLLRWGR